MTAAIKHIIALRANEDYLASYFVADQTVFPAVPLDTTSWTLKLQAWRQAGTVDLTLGVVARGSEGFAPLDRAGGEWELRINHATIAAIPDTTGSVTLAFDVQATTATGDKVVIDEGTMVITRGITT